MRKKQGKLIKIYEKINELRMKKKKDYEDE